MKRIAVPLIAPSLFLASSLAVAVAPSASGASCSYSGGDGLSAATAYEITTESDLQCLHDNVNDGSTNYSGKYFLQTGDIAWTGSAWTSGIGDLVLIGSAYNMFSGTYDGGGNEVQNLTISGTGSNVGLFGYIGATATVKNLGVTGTGSVSGVNNVGGLVGQATTGSAITNCYSTVDVTGSGNTVGGLVGFSLATVSTSFATGDVTGVERVGGLIGEEWYGISNSYASGGTVTGNNYVGALVGALDHGVTFSIATSYATSRVVTAGTYKGGIYGRVLTAGGSFTNDFWDTVTTTMSSSGYSGFVSSSFGKTTTQMTTLTTFTTDSPITASWSIASGWDATKVWGMCSTVNSGYPFLVSSYSSDPCNVPGATVSPTSVAFGSQAVGTTSSAQRVILTSSGTGSLTLGSSAVTIGGTHASDFALTTTCSNNQVLAPASTCTIDVTFTPGLTGSRSANLVITSDDASSPTVVPLTGTGSQAVATASPSSLDFGVVAVGTTSGAETLTITSSGTADLVLGTATITGSDAVMFAMGTDNCSGQTLVPTATCTIDLTFTPTSEGSRSATLSLPSNDVGTPLSVALTGGEEVALTVEPQRFIFTFNTSSGGVCLPTVTVIDTHVYQLPGAGVACVPEGSELVGWSIRGQVWNFAPAAEVVVSADQTFTAVAYSPTIEVTYDANVGMGTECLTDDSNISQVEGRWVRANVERSGAYLAKTAPCTPAGFELAGWTDANTPDGSGTARADAAVLAPGSEVPATWGLRSTNPMNTIHLYALWKWVG